MALNMQLTKGIQVQLTKVGLTDNLEGKVEVKAVFDVSGSTQQLYNYGLMENAVNTVAHVAFLLDDDGHLQTYLFGSDCNRIEDVTEDNYNDYIQNHILETKSPIMWTMTYYHTFIKMVVEQCDDIFKQVQKVTIQQDDSFMSKVKSLFGAKSNKTIVENNIELVNFENAKPKLVFVFTDGEDLDESTTKIVIDQYKDLPFYWMYVGIGDSNQFKFINKLSKQYDNIGFVNINNIKNMSSDDITQMVINQKLADWLNNKL